MKFEVFKYSVLLLVFSLSFSQEVVKYRFQDNGVELSIGLAVRLVSSGIIDTTTANDTDYVGIIFTKETSGSSRYYGVINSGVFEVYIKAGVSAGDFLTTASGGTLTTASSGNIIVGKALEDGPSAGNPAALRKVVLFLENTLVGNFIWNQDSAAQSADFWIAGTGKADTGFISGISSSQLIGYKFATSDFNGMFMAGSNKLGFATKGDTAMVIDSIGEVGLGVTKPRAKIHIDGGEIWMFNDGANPRFVVGDDTLVYGFMMWESSTDNVLITDYSYSGNGLRVKSGHVSIGNVVPTQPLMVYEGSSTPLLVVNEDYDNVGIGISIPDTGAKLDVRGGDLFLIDSSKNVRFVIGEGLGGADSYATFSWDTANDELRLGVAVEPEGVVLQSDGSVRISQGLVVNERGWARDFRAESDGNQYMLYVDAADDRVGIGTSNPQKELDVNGQVRIRNLPSGSTSDYLVTADANGNLRRITSTGISDADWVRGSGALDTVLFTYNYLGIARGDADNMLYGNYVHTHINLGVACTTGISGQNYMYCTVGGGYRNKSARNYSVVAGGRQNTANSDYSFVGGGRANNAWGGYSVVVGGYANTADDDYSFIGSGLENKSGDNFSAVVSGEQNIADGEYSFVGSGESNRARGNYSSVVGGQGNIADGENSFIGGGIENNARRNYDIIVGGYQNRADGELSIIGGGRENTTDGDYSAVLGGRENQAALDYSGVVTGYHNRCAGYSGIIGGGYQNAIEGKYSAILGGRNNIAGGSAADSCSAICGGYNNIADSAFVFIGSGYKNRVRGYSSGILTGIENYITGDFSYVFGRACTLSSDYVTQFYDDDYPGTLLVAGDIVPAADDQYDLGRDDQRWDDIYISGGTIHIGNSSTEGTISFNTTSSLMSISADSISISDLPSGSSSDSILTIDYSTGVIHRRNINDFISDVSNRIVCVYGKHNSYQTITNTGYTIVDLDSVNYIRGSGISVNLSANTISLPPGTYHIRAVASLRRTATYWGPYEPWVRAVLHFRKTSPGPTEDRVVGTTASLEYYENDSQTLTLEGIFENSSTSNETYKLEIYVHFNYSFFKYVELCGRDGGFTAQIYIEQIE